MAGHVEREFKLELSGAAAAARLREALGAVPARTVEQTNHFFDTPARALRSGRLALRLRAEDGRWLLTLKGPRSEGTGALAGRAEEEFALDERLARALLEGHACPLAAFEQGPLGSCALVGAARARVGAERPGRLGAFTNERTRLGPLGLGALPPVLVLELDHTTFPDGVAHELEAELPAGIAAEALEAELRALLARLELPWRPAGNKAARFFRALDSARDTQL
jgi:uncharacterized protein YjbK